jgi:thiol-disulfide isomerase/thioredoxin
MPLRDVVPKPWALAGALLLISSAVLAIEQPWKPHSAPPAAPANLPPEEQQYRPAADFTSATAWINSAPLDLASLRGKVVLVDFWTYSCINCIHTFPYVEGWYERYKDDGLVVVGVHTPEFRFEHDVSNIQAAVQRYNLTYPVAVDSDYGIWQAYSNRYWPAEYLIDQWGRIRHESFGEGEYDASENAIRDALTAAGHAPGPARANVPGAPTFLPGLTPELYIGNGEGRGALGNGAYHDGPANFELPSSIARDKIYLGGTWQENDENFTALGPAEVELKFYAGGGNLVADGPQGGCVALRLDGKPFPMDHAAKDVQNVSGTPCLVLDGPRSYDFYAGPVEEHTVLLDVPQGFTLFTFDFAAQGRT